MSRLEQLLRDRVIESQYTPGVAYQVQRLLGEGGTAAAFLAIRRTATGESPCVVKIILPSLASDASGTAAKVVTKEAVALGRLNERVPPTPYVVRLMDTGSVSIPYGGASLNLPWIALEYVHGGVEGTTLEERVAFCVRETGFAFDAERAVRAVRALAEGLREIHTVGVVHRDLTPGNVLCCGSDTNEILKISDFGIARPAGITVTFGDVLLGTPGYVAPEQAFAGEVPVGPYSDIFSLAAIVYFLLTGEPYFKVATPIDALVAARSAERRSVCDAAGLCPELREREAACRAIDMALARASSPDPSARPQEARHFMVSILPWIQGQNRQLASSRFKNTIERLRDTDPMPGAKWNTRHPSGDERVVRSVAWDGAGHCLAATNRGLSYWNGNSWTAAPSAGLGAANAAHFVERTSPGSYLIGGEGSLIVDYSADGVRERARGPDPNVTLKALSGDPDDLAVMIGERPGGPPLLLCLSAGRWLRPLVVEDAVALSGLARLGDECWLVVGRSRTGSGYAASYSPLAFELSPLSVPPTRALIACATRPEAGRATIVGADGVHLRVGPLEVPSSETGGLDFTCLAVDLVGREWIASRGAIHLGNRDGLRRVWHDPRWKVPFVSMMSEVGLVVAMSADGGVLECRATTLDKTQPASAAAHR